MRLVAQPLRPVANAPLGTGPESTGESPSSTAPEQALGIAAKSSKDPYLDTRTGTMYTSTRTAIPCRLTVH
mgnify:CR=1 FL=1